MVYYYGVRSLIAKIMISVVRNLIAKIGLYLQRVKKGKIAWYGAAKSQEMFYKKISLCHI